MPRARRLRNCSSNPGRDKRYVFLQTIQFVTETHLASCSTLGGVGAGGEAVHLALLVLKCRHVVHKGSVTEKLEIYSGSAVTPGKCNLKYDAFSLLSILETSVLLSNLKWNNMYFDNPALLLLAPWIYLLISCFLLLQCRKIFFPVNIYAKYGPGSSVGIATDYGLDGPGIESRWG